MIALSLSLNHCSDEAFSLTSKVSKGKEIGLLSVGTVFPMTGPQAQYGEEAMLGVELALEDIKKSDPEFAKHIRIFRADDRSTPQGAKEAARLLHEKRASILMGSVTETNSKALVSENKHLKLPLIIPASSSLAVEFSSPLVFRSCFLDKWQGELMARFFINGVRKNSIAVLTDPQSNYSTDLGASFKKTLLGLGGKIAYSGRYFSKRPQFEDHLKKIKMSDAEAIFFPSTSVSEITQMMELLKKMHIPIPLLGGDKWQNSKIKYLAGKAYPGHFFVQNFSPNIPEQLTVDFVRRFKKVTRRYPSALAAMTYDAMILIGDSFKRAGTMRTNELLRSISRAEHIPGLLGPITVNKYRTAEKSGVVMRTTKNGAQFYQMVHPLS